MQVSALRFRPPLAARFLLTAALSMWGSLISAQQPAPAVTLAGVVVEATTGTPISGAFLSVGERGPRAISDAAGAFRLPAVSAGEQTILVRRFGYMDMSLNVLVEGAARPLRVILQPAPIALEGLDVMGRAEVALAGRVTNAKDGSAIPWASLTLSRDVVRKEGSASSDPDGIFRIDGVPTGQYFLRAQALGYVPQYLMIDVTAPPAAVQLALEPDSAIQAGVTRFNGQLKGRRNYLAGINYAYNADRLHYTAAPSATDFLETDASVSFIDCAGSRTALGDQCIIFRGNVVEPAVYIDELPIMVGLEVLESYAPSEFYLIEVFNSGRTIRAYTYEFMEKMAKKPRALLVPWGG